VKQIDAKIGEKCAPAARDSSVTELARDLRLGLGRQEVLAVDAALGLIERPAAVTVQG